MDLIGDMHMHTLVSGHAYGTIREMAQAAQAKGLEMIKAVGGEQGLLVLKAYEALQKMSDGQATKIIVPSDMQGIAGLALSLKEIVEKNKIEEPKNEETH